MWNHQNAKNMQFIGAVSLINDQEFGSIDKVMQHSDDWNSLEQL